jgi:hypothetical protein
MNVDDFLLRCGVRENPFRGEEARHDGVFARMGGGDSGIPGTRHSDFEKVVGDLHRPATAVVFGEKGSGKTAMRLQLASRIARHNEAHPDARVFLIPYDELNGVLDQFHARLASSRTPDRRADKNASDTADILARFQLRDHIDAMLTIGVGRTVNALLGGPDSPQPANLGEHPLRRARTLPAPTRQDLVLLASIYDQHDVDGRRTRHLRRALRVPGPRDRALWLAAAALGWLPAAGLLSWFTLRPPAWTAEWMKQAALAAVGLALLLYALILLKVLLTDRLLALRLGRRAHRAMRTTPRSPESLAASLAELDRALRTPAFVPQDKSDEVRYTLLDKLRRALAQLGFSGMLAVVDRVDEPTLINGDPARMRSIVWPLFSNKFLQQESFGVKMLLPSELRHALYKESSAFFQEARLDKQNLVERLTWTGPMLYDLCTARLTACADPARTASTGPDAKPLALLDLFAEDVTRQDLVDALDQMHQPRDAFKFLYRCITEHCSNVTADQHAFRVPRLILDQVRKAEAERVQQLERGIRPA